MTIDLSTHYMGLELRNPLVPSAGPMTRTVESMIQLESHGAAAVVLPSLFQEQIQHDEDQLSRLHEFATDSFSEASDYFPEQSDYGTGPDSYLNLISKARDQLSIPVIASLNGCTTGGWSDFAQEMEQAGADGLELNIFFIPTDTLDAGANVEQRYLSLVESVCDSVSIPVAVKCGPYFSSFPNMARNFADCGASALVIFNRFLQPDVDLDSMAVTPHLELSRSSESRLALQWIGILHGRVNSSLAHSTGIHLATDVIKSLLVGSDIVMMTAALLKFGPAHLSNVLLELTSWLEEHEYESVRQMQGSMSQLNCPDPSAFMRANYMHALTSYVGENE